MESYEMLKKFKDLWPAFCLAFILSLVIVQPSIATPDLKTAGRFVTEFYKWYVPIANQESQVPAFETAIKLRERQFAPGLLRHLAADSAAQETCADLIGLDFDPILNTQDPAKTYRVGPVKYSGHSYSAPVYAVWSGKESEKPDLEVRFSYDHGQWRFLNFYYPHKSNLLDLLKAQDLKCETRQ